MRSNIQTIKDIKSYLVSELAEAYPREEILAFNSIIIKTLFKVSGLHVLNRDQDHVTKKLAERIISICRELKRGKPLQYILGETNFYNCLIRVNPDVLIPRPETEELVDLIIKENKEFCGAILDVGTGSGCIAIALSVNIKGSQVVGIDNSEGAIRISEENARLNNASAKFIRSDILKPDLDAIGNIGLIVSNPPYIRESEKIHIMRNVIDYEPHTALFVPDADPLLYYQAILEVAKTVLGSGGKIYFEINEALGEEIAELLNSSGYSEVKVIRDINNKNRFVKGIK